ncbi:MAG: restriction endonuclease subunit S [Proteobacteria bacterium]|nr:restriction endonuclease subunit S [Pseudomonadota bacterium]
MGDKHLQEAVPDGAAAVRYQPYSEYKESGVEWIGNVPKHWGVKRLKFLSIKIGSGVTPRGGATVYQNSGIPLLRSQNIHFDGLKLHDVAFIDESVHADMKNSQVKTGDVLLNITGASIGRCYFWGDEYEDANVNQHVCIIRPNAIITTSYLFYAMSSDAGQTQINVEQTGAGREGLNFEALKTFSFSLPSIPEQQTIAAFLDYKTAKIDALIAKKKALLEKLLEKRTALISHAVTKGLDPKASMRDSGIDWLGEIPAHWETKRIKHLLKYKKAAIKTGPFGSQLQSSEMNDSEVKVYNQKNVISQDLKGGNNYISFEKYRDLIAFEVFPDDLLVTTRGTIGRCLIVPHDAEKGILHPCLMRLQINQKQILNSYLKVLIGESGFVFEHLKLMSNATTIEVIYSESLKEVWLPIPPVDEQYKILEHLNESIGELEAFTHKVEIVITRLQEYRSALITNAVTGKIDVRNFRLPEAEELVNHG